jgi:Glycine transporter
MTDHRRTRQARLLQFIDVAGTFVPAIQGASIAADKGLDAFGIVVVSLATATGGGVMRDVLIGESPPEALRGWPIVTAALLGALTTFFAFHIVEEIPEHILIVVDALGLSLLAVSGTEKALAFRLTPIAAVMMGAISGRADIRSGISCSPKFRPFSGRLSCNGGDYRLDRRGHRSERQDACQHRSPLGCGNMLRPQNRCGLATLAFADAKPALNCRAQGTARPLVSSSRA